MKANFIVKVIISFSLLISIIGCSSRIDHNKFAKLYRSTKSVEGAIQIGVTYQKFGELLQNYATEILIIKNEDMTPEELKLFNIYIEALGIFNDSLKIWKESLEDIKHDWIPKGGIFVGSELAPIVIKYKLLTEDHEYPKGNKWQTISDTSIQIVWKEASLKLDEADKLITSYKEVSVLKKIESKIIGRRPWESR